jgi:Ca2+/Na+ antiporter
MVHLSVKYLDIFNKKCYKYVKVNFKAYFRSLMILIALYYLVAIVVLTLHFTGHLERWNLEWLVFVLAITVFPAVLYL